LTETCRHLRSVNTSTHKEDEHMPTSVDKLQTLQDKVFIQRQRTIKGSDHLFP